MSLALCLQWMRQWFSGLGQHMLITVLTNNTTVTGIGLKSTCDAHTRLMGAFEFVEIKKEQGKRSMRRQEKWPLSRCG
jgi:hypothetical protein